MKKVWKMVAVLCILLCLTTTLAGCGSGSYNQNSSSDPENGGSEMLGLSAESAVSADQKTAYEEAAGTDASVQSAKVQDTSRKLITTVKMEVETKAFDGMLSALTAKIDGLGGYTEKMESYNGSIYSSYQSTRSAYMVIRVPAEKLDEFLEEVSGIGNVVNSSRSVEDVTLTYVDMESQKTALETEQARLLELLEKAETIEDIITIEQRLSAVRYQIESMASQLRTYDNKVDYSTVTLNINEVLELTPVAEESTWTRISSGFVGSIRNIGRGLREFAVWLLVNSPYLVIWAVVITIVVFIVLKSMKKNKAVSGGSGQQRKEQMKEPDKKS